VIKDYRLVCLLFLICFSQKMAFMVSWHPCVPAKLPFIDWAAGNCSGGEGEGSQIFTPLRCLISHGAPPPTDEEVQAVQRAKQDRDLAAEPLPVADAYVDAVQAPPPRCTPMRE